VQVPISEGSNTPAYENVCVYPGRSDRNMKYPFRTYLVKIGGLLEFHRTPKGESNLLIMKLSACSN